MPTAIRLHTQTHSTSWVGLMWFLTCVAWGLPYLLQGTLGLCLVCNVVSLGMAILLLFSRSRAAVLHGGVRLLMQLGMVCMVLVALAQNPSALLAAVEWLARG